MADSFDEELFRQDAKRLMREAESYRERVLPSLGGLRTTSPSLLLSRLPGSRLVGDLTPGRYAAVFYMGERQDFLVGEDPEASLREALETLYRRVHPIKSRLRPPFRGL